MISYGSTGLEQVRQQMAQWNKILEDESCHEST